MVADGQFSFGGLTFGEGTNFPVREVSGLRGRILEASGAALDAFDVSHGESPGVARQRPRDIVVPFVLRDSANSVHLNRVEALLDALGTNAAESLSELRFKEKGIAERLVYARIIEVAHAYSAPGFHNKVVRIPVRFRAPDPRVYDGVETVVNIGQGSNAVCNNQGKHFALPLLQVTNNDADTITGITITNDTTGVVFTSTTDIANTKTYNADMRLLVAPYQTAAGLPNPNPIIRIDSNNFYHEWSLPRTPLLLQPGNNTVSFTLTGGGVTGQQATVRWRHVWLA